MSMAQQENDPREDMNPSDWNALWTAGVARGELFDKEHASPALAGAIAEDWIPVGAGVGLVPGCGRGYDVELLARSDRLKRVIGIEVSTVGAGIATDYLNAQGLDKARWEIACADFFEFQKPAERVEFILDYTFLCALPRARREDWAARMHELLAPGGSLVTLVYPMGKTVEEGGPPHGVSFEDLTGLLEGKGFRVEDGPRMLSDQLSHKGREGRTGYARWLRVE